MPSGDRTETGALDAGRLADEYSNKPISRDGSIKLKSSVEPPPGLQPIGADEDVWTGIWNRNKWIPSSTDWTLEADDGAALARHNYELSINNRGGGWIWKNRKSGLIERLIY